MSSTVVWICRFLPGSLPPSYKAQRPLIGCQRPHCGRLAPRRGRRFKVALAGAKELGSHLKTVVADLGSLADHTSYLSSKANFLLDTTLGLINIEQNGIIKIFSVAAVVLLPPTLVASVYGMNFEVDEFAANDSAALA